MKSRWERETERSISQSKYRNKKKEEGFTGICPQCSYIVTWNNECKWCGYKKKIRNKEETNDPQIINQKD